MKLEEESIVGLKILLYASLKPRKVKMLSKTSVSGTKFLRGTYSGEPIISSNLDHGDRPLGRISTHRVAGKEYDRAYVWPPTVPSFKERHSSNLSCRKLHTEKD
jgi:hypothetical protein